jgi:hypothetical protein
LKDDPYLGTALAASWESNTNTGFTKLNPNPQRFLGFLEGRTRLKVPLEWEVWLITELHRDDQKLIDSSLKRYLPIAPFLKDVDGSVMDVSPPFSQTPLGIWIPPGTELKKHGKMITISVGANSVTVREELLDRLRKASSGDLLKAVLGPKHSYIALFSGSGQAFPLLCLESNSGRVIWEAETWGYGGENVKGVGTGITHHEIEIVVGDKKVALFGQGWGCYLEVFDRDTGANLCRFSTSYWVTKP